jgi:PAS domain S-box-containing protein
VNSDDPVSEQDEEQRIAALIHRLHETVRELQELTGGQVDAVADAGKQPFLLNDAQEKLRQSETRYRALATATAQIVWTATAEGRVHGVLPEWQDYTGQSSEEIQVDGWSKALHPEDREHVLKVWMEAVKNDTPYETEYRLRRHDGVYRDFAVRRVPVHRRDGSTQEWVGCCADITERKRAEESLKLFRVLIDQSDDAIEVVDPQTGQYLDVNETAGSRLGYSREEMLSMNIADIGDAQMGPSYRPDILKDLQKSGSKIIEGRHRRKDGSTFPVEVNTKYIHLERDYLVAVVRDITMRQQTENERDRLFNLSEDLLSVGSMDGRLVQVNPAWTRTLGWSQIEMTERPWLDFVHPDDRAATIRASEYQNSGKPLRDFENRYRCKNGSYRWLSWNVHPLMESRQLFCVARDVTKRKQNEARMSEQAALLDIAHEAIMVKNLDDQIIYWNKGAERIYKWRSEEVLGRKANELFNGDPVKYKAALTELFARGEWAGEMAKHAKNGSELTVDARWTVVRDEKDMPKSVLAIDTDITDRKKLEVQFLRAQRMESIGTLAGGIAHDLNNILAPIMMSIDLLREMSDNPEAASILQTIAVSAKRGADIVKQVLSFARGVDGDRTGIEAKDLLKDLEDIAKDTFPKDIRLKFSVSKETWTILGDPTQVHQVLLNLCVNARDAMPHGGALNIGAENCVLDEQYAAVNIQAKPGRYVKIAVSDSGIGMPPEVIDKIFEPFFTTKDLDKGTGLGLSTVMAIVKSHGGSITVYSELGRGTTFNVYLPVMLTSAAARKEPSGDGGDNLPRGQGETVLVVDDEASILTITSQTLRAFGYRVLTATDGAEGVSTYAEHQSEIAVVLTDMMMPVMDGPTMIHALMEINPSVKIITGSGLNRAGGTVKAPGLGVKYFLTKPYTSDTMLKALRLVLDGP